MKADGKTRDLSSYSPEEKKRFLYEKQKATLDTFLARGAISKDQYDKSLGDMIEKMRIGHGGIGSNEQ